MSANKIDIQIRNTEESFFFNQHLIFTSIKAEVNNREKESNYGVISRPKIFHFFFVTATFLLCFVPHPAVICVESNDFL